MAINKNEIKELLDTINYIFDIATSNLPNQAREFLKSAIMGAAYKEIEELITQSKPPVMLLMGRSGHGKSSLINALANQDVAIVSDTEPCSNGQADGKTNDDDEVLYCINFEKSYAEWQIIDTRGIFETTRPEGASGENPIDLLKKAINKYQPDILIHVISMPEVRNLSNDLNLLKDNFYATKPTIAVLTKADTIKNPREWPPEQYPAKAGLIKESLDYFSEKILNTAGNRIDPNSSIKGYHLAGKTYIGVVPVSSCKEELWNIDTLAYLIGEHLPNSAKLDFFQALKRKNLLKKISTSIIKRFSVIAGTIGASPIPISDIIVLIPLQILMISIIAGLSCRQLNTKDDVEKAVKEFLSVLGINLGIGFSLKILTQQLSKLIPFPILNNTISGGFASSGTFGLGKAAEAYFFSGENKRPEEFEDEWKTAK